MTILARLLRRCVAERRPPDFVIGDNYLRRWWVIPRNAWFNIYLHEFRHSDDDRALHDHPWWNASLLLEGSYQEFTRDGVFLRREGAIYFRRPTVAHRVALINDQPVWTLFITGPRVREWGFLCPRGWRHWREFTDARDKGQVGRGCD